MAKRNILPIFIPHLGCPNDCVFCNQRRISGSLVPSTARDVERLLETARQNGTRGAELAFYGGSFTAVEPALQEELLSAAVPYREDGTVVSVRLSTRPDAVDETVIERLRRFGVETVELGAQSMDDHVLYEAGRGHTAADTVRAVGLLKNAGFTVILQMMTGLPGADPASDTATAEKIIALRPAGVRIYPTVIIRDTPLAELWQRGEYREHTVQDAVRLCADLLPLFERAGIPVIRLGLNPTDELSGGAAMAGAYHPALGELVRSEILYRAAKEKLASFRPENGAAVLVVNPYDFSAMIGHHRENITRLQAEFGLKKLKVRSDAGAGDEVTVISDGAKREKNNGTDI